MGYLLQLQRGPLVLWQIETQDAQQQPARVLLGNGLEEEHTYDTKANRLNHTNVRTVDQIVRLQEDYGFDKLGNVTSRNQQWDIGSQTPTGFVELFGSNNQSGYDTLNRLTNSSIAGLPTQNFTYDATGNLLTKTGVGTGIYHYLTVGVVQPHAVSSIDGLGSFTYDLDGNQSSAPGRTAIWTSFDMPQKLTKSGGACNSFVYGPEHQRTRQDKGGVDPFSRTV